MRTRGQSHQVVGKDGRQGSSVPALCWLFCRAGASEMRAERGTMSGLGSLPASKPSVDACSLPAPRGPVG